MTEREELEAMKAELDRRESEIAELESLLSEWRTKEDQLAQVASEMMQILLAALENLDDPSSINESAEVRDLEQRAHAFRVVQKHFDDFDQTAHEYQMDEEWLEGLVRTRTAMFKTNQRIDQILGEPRPIDRTNQYLERNYPELFAALPRLKDAEYLQELNGVYNWTKTQALFAYLLRSLIRHRGRRYDGVLADHFLIDGRKSTALASEYRKDTTPKKGIEKLHRVVPEADSSIDD